MDSLTREIEEQLERYLQGERTLSDFEAWLVPETWDLSPQADRPAHELATAITLRIAEFTSGDWSEEELRAALADLPRSAVSPLILSSETFTYSTGDGKQAALGFQTDLVKFAVVGTGRSEVVA